MAQASIKLVRAAIELGISEHRLRKLVAQGVIRPETRGRAHFFSDAEIRRMKPICDELKRNRNPGPRVK